MQTRSISRLPLLVALGCALLPFLAVHLSYLLAADTGHVPWCLPYVDSCTSISATGRNAPASFVFKGSMLPAAMLIAVFWWLQADWLRATGDSGNRVTWMRALGCVASLGLVLYVIVLGEVGDWWRTQRKIGTVLFFSFTYLAQLLFADALRRQQQPSPGVIATSKRMLGVCVLMLAIGIGSVISETFNEPVHDRIEYAIEWVLALLLQLNFLFAALLWRQLDWTMAFQRRA
ncbi:MAG: hypothetical protein V2I82_01060 [Halieaceae bacterium]|nr:hypothetical protein [Halieaceae bacterium]